MTATNQLDTALAGLEIGKDKLLTLYRQMVAIRLFEEARESQSYVAVLSLQPLKPGSLMFSP